MTDTDRLFFLDQHGCAKNQVDGELLIGRLLAMGWKRTDDAENASLIIINTCGFIESAKTESLQSLMEARAAYPEAKIVFAGCLAERYMDAFSDDLPEADALFGNGDLSRFDDIVSVLFADKASAAFKTTGRPCVKPPQEGVCAGPRPEFLNFPSSAYVKITEGCNNCCAFCAIPVIRGELRSRPQSDIIAEIKELRARGVFEINLIGQDLAAYGRDGVPKGKSNHPSYSEEPSPLKKLLEEITALPGDFWVRLLYIHPDHFPFDILDTIARDSRILPYFDVPFQSGSNNVLSAMNRTGSRESYAALAQRVREAGAVLRTTFLAGFPGETDEDARETEEFLKLVRPDWSGCFPYSREEDTPAYSMKKQVSHKKAAERASRLEELQSVITQERLASHVGNEYKVLIEEIIDDPENDAGIALGRSWFQAPEVDGATIVRYELDSEEQKAAVQPGKVVRVKVLGVSGVDIDTLFVGACHDE
ncbi:MAG: 30S ribosomal protein S12 methylthiotransferase RimO [Treponema sp.]|nr:30S ribosomal protein S12 methylthiotransferase RimO [Candidatus Treponema caballi]